MFELIVEGHVFGPIELQRSHRLQHLPCLRLLVLQVKLVLSHTSPLLVLCEAVLEEIVKNDIIKLETFCFVCSQAESTLEFSR